MNPCFCGGPFARLPYEDRPDTALGREHESGSDGCYYRPPKGERPARWMNRPEWVKRAQSNSLPAKEYTR